MKLPGIQERGVQSLGRESNARAQAVQAEGAADQALLNLGADVVTEVAEITDKYEKSKADVNLRTKMADLASEFEGQEYVDPMDPRLDDVDFSREDENGNPRDRVPVHEVYAQLYENTARKALSESEAMISRPGSRDAWIATYATQAEESIARTKIKAQAQKIQYQLSEQNQDLATLQAEGRYSAMDAALENYIGSAEEKEKWKSIVTVGSAKDDIQQIESTGTPEQMRAEAVNLRDEKADYPFSMEYRQQQADALEKAADTVADRNANQDAHEWVQVAFASGKTEQQIVAEAQALENSKMSDKAVSLAKSRIAFEKALEQDQQNEIYMQAELMVRGDLDQGIERRPTSDIPREEWVKMTPQMRAKLEELERTPISSFSLNKEVSEEQRYTDLLMMASNPDQLNEFIALEIPVETMSWDKSRREDIRNIWQGARNAAMNGDTKYKPTGATRTQIVNEYIQKAYGKEFKELNEEQATNAARFSGALDTQIEIFYKDQKRNPTATEMREISNKLVKEELLEKRWYWDREGPRFEKSIPGIPDSELNDFYEVIQANPKWAKAHKEGTIDDATYIRIYQGIFKAPPVK